MSDTQTTTISHDWRTFFQFGEFRYQCRKCGIVVSHMIMETARISPCPCNRVTPWVPVDLGQCDGVFLGGNAWQYREKVPGGVRVWRLTHEGWDGGADHERRDTADC